MRDNIRDCADSFFGDCSTEECYSPEEWDDAKDTFRTVGIVLIVLSLISLVAGLVLIMLMFTSLCKKNNQGMVYTSGGGATVSVLNKSLSVDVTVS